MFFKPVLLTAT